MLLERERQVPDQVVGVAGLLQRFGFATEAEMAYKAFIARIELSRSAFYHWPHSWLRRIERKKRSRFLTRLGKHAVPTRLRERRCRSTSLPPPMRRSSAEWRRGSPRRSSGAPPRLTGSARSWPTFIACRSATTKRRLSIARCWPATPTASRH